LRRDCCRSRRTCKTSHLIRGPCSYGRYQAVVRSGSLFRFAFTEACDSSNMIGRQMSGLVLPSALSSSRWFLLSNPFGGSRSLRVCHAPFRIAVLAMCALSKTPELREKTVSPRACRLSMLVSIGRRYTPVQARDHHSVLGATQLRTKSDNRLACNHVAHRHNRCDLRACHRRVNVGV
jgi:hypothetical protein